jgi:hypothetical protein
MRSYLLCLLTFFIVGIANAQSPIITSASTAIAGDINTYKYAKTAAAATPATGANVSWDYSALIDSGVYAIDSFVAPSSTAYASFFSGTNLALSIGSGGYAYYKTSSTDWSELGAIIPGASGDTVHFTNGNNQFHFPFTYGNTYLDSSQQIISTGFGATTFEYTVSHNATGYGTLKTPKATYSNVLMVKTIDVQRFQFLTLITLDTTTTIYFVTPTLRSYIMQMGLNDQNKIINVKYLIPGVVVPPTSYTFTGTGDWSTAANWVNSAVPTSPVPSGTTVTISPQAGGSCILNVPVTFAAGSTLTVSTGAKFNIQGNLTISN